MPIDNYKKLRAKLTKLINAETYYNYAQMAIKLKSNPDQYSKKIHGVTAQEAYNVADAVFSKKIGFTENIESFLLNLKTVPNYRIIIEQKKKELSK